MLDAGERKDSLVIAHKIWILILCNNKANYVDLADKVQGLQDPHF